MIDRIDSSHLQSSPQNRIAQNPLVEESISSNRFNPAWDRLPTPLLVVRPVGLWFNAVYWGDLPKRLSLSETGSPAYTRTSLAQSSDLELIANTDCPSRLILEMLQASTSDMSTRSLFPYFTHMIQAHPTC